MEQSVTVRGTCRGHGHTWHGCTPEWNHKDLWLYRQTRGGDAIRRCRTCGARHLLRVYLPVPDVADITAAVTAALAEAGATVASVRVKRELAGGGAGSAAL